MHIRQFKVETGLNWLEVTDTDAFMCTIINPIYKIIAKNVSNKNGFNDIKNDLASTFASANYLLEKGIHDPYEELRNTENNCKEFGIAINA